MLQSGYVSTTTKWYGYSGDVGFGIMLLITLTVYFSDHS